MSPNTDYAAVASGIRRAVAQGDGATLQQLVEEVASYCFGDSSTDQFSPLLFDVVLESLGHERFWAMPGSYHLLMLLEYDWGMLSADQQTRLLPAIENAYARFEDWMASFVISELLGKCYADENGLATLKRLATTQAGRARSLVPLGFEHLARYAKIPDLKRESMDCLRHMLEDSSDEVRREAADSLNRLAGKPKD
jgi:hypothetical protein